jgi:transcriptional regulator with XRE-family HTH domain
MSDNETSRAVTLGELVRSARLKAGRSVEECSQVLGEPAEVFALAEEGEAALSLPDLEALSMYLKVPMSYFWGSQEPEQNHEPDYAAYVGLRTRIVGALLRQARIEHELSAEQLAGELGVVGELGVAGELGMAGEIGADAKLIEAYELGTKPIPYFDLEKLAAALNLTMEYFSEPVHGPLAQYELDREMQKRYGELPPEVKAFVAEPVNVTYLQTAMHLSEMDVDRLRHIAESILDITL